jgi:integrase
MAHRARGHVAQLPSGAFRVRVYAGRDPVTGMSRYLTATAPTEDRAELERARLLAEAEAGAQPGHNGTVAQLLDKYMEVMQSELELTTRATYEGYIRRCIVPAIGVMQLRKVRGPVLDSLYARLRRCGNPLCTGKPFTEHRNVPELRIDRRELRRPHEQLADGLRAGITSGQLQPGEELPPLHCIAEGQGVPLSTLQRAVALLAEEKLLVRRAGRPVAVSPELEAVAGSAKTRPAGHDCQRSGCQSHVCKPLRPGTIRQIHGILAGAFAAAERWEWVARNPAESAKPPKINGYRPPSSPSAADVAKVLAAVQERDSLLASYLWLAAVTGARRGELCGLRWSDFDPDLETLHLQVSYVVRDGERRVKDTKTHQKRTVALDPVTCQILRELAVEAAARLAVAGLVLDPGAFIFARDPAGREPINPDWFTHQVTRAAAGIGVRLNIKALRHYTASQLLAGGIDLRNAAARLGHSGGGATTLRHYADPISEVDRRAATYLAKLIPGPIEPSATSAE